MDATLSQSILAKPDRALRSSILLAGICLILGLWAAVLYLLQVQREAALDQARRDTANLARVLEEQLIRTIAGIDQRMQFLQRDFEKDPAGFNLAQWLGDAPKPEDSSFQLGIADADGSITASSLGPITAPVSIADRDHFRAHVERDTGQPYISRPLLTRFAGKWALQITRRLNKPDGQFAGIVATSMDPNFLVRFYQSIDLGPGGIVTILGRDGFIRARTGLEGERLASTLERSLAETPMFTLPDPAGTYEITSSIDGVDHIHSYRRLVDFPLIVNVGFARNDVLAANTRQSRIAIPALVLLSLILAAVFAQLARVAGRRRRDRLELAAERRRLSETIDALDGPLVLYDREGRLQLWNAATTAYFPKLLSVFRVGLSRKQARDAMVQLGYLPGNEALATNLATPASLAGRTRDGRHMYWRRIVMADGSVLVLITEVTALRRAERRLEAAIAALDGGFALFDVEDRLVLCNESFRQESGPMADRIEPGLTFRELSELVWESGVIRERRPGETKEQYIERRVQQHRAADGTPHEIYRSARTLRRTEYRTAEGEIVRISIDVTDLRTKENELRRLLDENERLSEAALARRTFILQAVMDTMPDGLVILDDQQGAVFWNHGFLRLAGLAGSVDTNDTEALRGSTLEGVLRPFALAGGTVRDLASGRDRAVEQPLADGRSLHFQVLRAGGGNALLWVSDTTGRRREEAERQSLRDRVLQAQKSDAIGAIVGTVAHDFNNLLTVMMGFASRSQEQLGVLETLSDQLPAIDPATRRVITHVMAAVDAVRKSQHDIVEGASRGQRIVANLMTFAKARTGERAVGDVVETVRGAERLIGIALPSSVKLEILGGVGASLARHDRVTLEQALLNLCLNGAHALEGRPGRIELKVESIWTDGKRAESLRAEGSGISESSTVLATDRDGSVQLWRGLLPAGRYVRIDVTDDGCGMDAGTMARIFETFFTTKPHGVGTGLGLASVASIMDSHGGAIHVRSKPGQGTTFSLFLMAARTAEAVGPGEMTVAAADTAKPAVRRVAEPSAKRGARILVIDDERSVAKLMEMTLADEGYAVERFTDPVLAMARLTRDPDTVDLVVTDQTMPVLTGTMLAAEVARVRPDLPVLLCTGYSGEHIDDQALPQGVRAVLHKPYKPHHLADCVKRMLIA
ncbi:MAG: PAS-domain containing protein [Proteobacteria bacterium]|nr:PAS-domain containing protein [Pseudomonadota bacterium]